MWVTFSCNGGLIDESQPCCKHRFEALVLLSTSSGFDATKRVNPLNWCNQGTLSSSSPYVIQNQLIMFPVSLYFTLLHDYFSQVVAIVLVHKYLSHLPHNRNKKWLSVQKRSESQVNTEPDMVLPSVSSCVKLRFHNTLHTVAHFVERML